MTDRNPKPVTRCWCWRTGFSFALYFWLTEPCPALFRCIYSVSGWLRLALQLRLDCSSAAMQRRSDATPRTTQHQQSCEATSPAFRLLYRAVHSREQGCRAQVSTQAHISYSFLQYGLASPFHPRSISMARSSIKSGVVALPLPELNGNASHSLTHSYARLTGRNRCYPLTISLARGELSSQDRRWKILSSDALKTQRGRPRDALYLRPHTQ